MSRIRGKMELTSSGVDFGMMSVLRFELIESGSKTEVKP
jgi:hypothetical protein